MLNAHNNTHSTSSIMSPNDYTIMPWKNGLGETLEIQRYQDQQGLRFRISQASVVEDGEFSHFAGLNRTLVLLSGDGITLHRHSQTGHNHQHDLHLPLEMAVFSGGDKTIATLASGKIEDLNIMVREADTKAEVLACYSPNKVAKTELNGVLFEGFYGNQPCLIRLGNDETITLDAHHFLLMPHRQDSFSLTQGSGVFIQILCAVA